LSTCYPDTVSQEERDGVRRRYFKLIRSSTVAKNIRSFRIGPLVLSNDLIILTQGGAALALG
jgi:hypothetical protein